MNESATAPAAVRDFAAAVRAHLDDLPADEVEELTDGLEADLTERAQDAGDSFGDPAEYARELRSASGLPEREHPSRRRFGTTLRRTGESAARRVRSMPGGARLLDLLIALRPVWWVMRGWVIFHLIAVPIAGARPGLPDNPVAWVFLLACILLSVEWGRGHWLAWQGFRYVKIALSTVAAVAFLPLLVSVASMLPGQSDPYVYPEPQQGLLLNGDTVENIFAYDCSGKPLTDVQLFDENGNPLSVAADGELQMFAYSGTGAHGVLIPNPGVTGGTGWNVFPLKQADAPTGQEPDPSTAEAPDPPFAVTQPLADADGLCPGSEEGSETGPGAPESPETPETPGTQEGETDASGAE
ncbi:hypothetical protein GCM10027416_04110 [Okibacterium endophyticum]